MTFVYYLGIVKDTVIGDVRPFFSKGLSFGELLFKKLNDNPDFVGQLFPLQILHHKNTFSAKGLTVDATLLTAIVGNITTYMLILIQFLIISYSCDKKS